MSIRQCKLDLVFSSERQKKAGKHEFGSRWKVRGWCLKEIWGEVGGEYIYEIVKELLKCLVILEVPCDRSYVMCLVFIHSFFPFLLSYFLYIPITASPRPSTFLSPPLHPSFPSPQKRGVLPRIAISLGISSKTKHIFSHWGRTGHPDRGKVSKSRQWRQR